MDGYYSGPLLELWDAIRENKSVEVVQSILKRSHFETRDLYGIVWNVFEYSDINNPYHEIDWIDANVMQLLINHDPAVAQCQAQDEGYDGKFLLHDACWANAPTQVIALLVEKNPAAVAMRVNNDWFPLHIACMSISLADALTETVTLLLSHYPDAARQSDTGGFLPLHHAVQNDAATEEVITALLESYPRGAQERTSMHHIHRRRGRLPIDFSYKRLNITRKLVECYPDCTHLPDANGDLPLHRALFEASRGLNIPLQVIQFLVEHHPGSVQVRGQMGLLPLHIAAKYRSVETVEFLIDCFPGGLEVQDNRGELPIHHAMDYGVPQIVQMLIDRNTSRSCGLDVADNNGRLPIHYASFSGGMSLESFRIVLAQYKQGVSMADGLSGLPLHYACSLILDERKLAMTRLLLDTDPFTVLKPSNDGLTPLELASRHENESSYSRQARELLLQGRQLLLETQDETLRLLHGAFMPTVDHFQLPDSIVAAIWGFVVPQFVAADAD